VTFETTDLTPRIGTGIRTDKATLLSGARAGRIRELLEQRGVLVMRDIDLTDAEEIAFAATLGDIRNDFGGDPIMRVTFDKTANPEYGDYFHGTFYWHIDGTHEDVPPRASIATPRVLAPHGTGQTEFANTYAAWDDLTDEQKARFEPIRIVHSKAASMRVTYPNPTPAEQAHFNSFAHKSHPLVWKHRSGRKSLVAGLSSDYVEGMEPEESAGFIQWVKDWMEQRQYVYTHQWRIGDVLIWDNTGTMHRVLPFDKSCGRRLHRVTLTGEESLAQAA
jgi:alpha-ketoglutarate-dependent taurine dioxygenase